jgi:hypothetical protein
VVPADSSYIRRGGHYKILGIVALIPAIVGGFVAGGWRPGWPWWAYFLTCLVPVLGYAVFLIVSLGWSISCTLTSVALISSVDSKTMPKATALLYTIRSLGGTLGVSIGGSIQLASLASGLRSRFADVHGREKVSKLVLKWFTTTRP